MNTVEWLSDGLNWIFNNNYYDELLEKIVNACDNASVKCEIR